MDLNQWLLAILASGGGGATIALALIRWFGGAWMESQFSKKLEAYRQENAIELQGLRARIDGALSAALRSQEKEFEVASECWRLSNIALGACQDLTNIIQRYQDIGRMSVEMRKEYLDKQDMLDSQREKILRSEDPTKEFIEYMFWNKLNLAENSRQNLVNYVRLNEIFLDPVLSAMLLDFSSKLSSAIVDVEIGKEMNDHKLKSGASKVVEQEAKPILDQVMPTLREMVVTKV